MRFVGVAKKGDGLRGTLEQLGIIAERQGSDLIIEGANAERLKLKSILSTAPRLILEKGKEPEIAKKLMSQLPTQYSEPNVPQPEKITLTKSFGILSDIERVTTLAMILPEPELEAFLTSELLPVMIEKLSARYVTTIVANAEYQQAWISLSKICFLTEKVGIDEAARLVQKNNAFATALPGGADVLSYLDTLTRFMPIAITLPIRRRLFASWHFQCEGAWGFPGALSNSFMHQFTILLSPLSTNSHHVGLAGLDITQTIGWQLLRAGSGAINCLMSFANDPRNFTKENGDVDFLKKIQTYAAINFIFADLSALNFSTTAHHRVSFSMSIFDKLANLRAMLSAGTLPESKIMPLLLSFSQRERLRNVFEKKFREFYPLLTDALISALDQSFDNLNEHLYQRGKQSEQETEARVLERLWFQRNLRHGPFLRNPEHFERIFLESDGSVPSALASVAYFLVLGFALDPRGFIECPEII